MQNVDETQLNTVLGQVLNDLGGAYSVALVRLGERLGLYQALHEGGPATAEALADRTKLTPRYVLEWASHQAVSSYLTYDPATGQFFLPPEQAMIFANPDSPVYLLGAFENTLSIIHNQPWWRTPFEMEAG